MGICTSSEHIEYYINGDVYKGEWKNNCPTGYGVMNYINGDIYKGNWKCGKKEGIGTHTFKNGIKLYGNYINNYFPSDGKLYYPNGDEYTGFIDINRIVPDIRGEMKYKDGRIYSGEWFLNKFRGKGELKMSEWIYIY